MGNVIPLDEIKTKEEYEETKKKVDYYASVYAWLENVKNPLEVIKGQIEGLLEKLSREDISNDEKKDILLKIHTLSVRSEKIQNGTYKNELISTITANALLVKQYEERENKKKWTEIVSEVVTGKLNFSEYIEKQTIISRINNSGIVPNPRSSIELQDSNSAVDYILNNYDLVGIKVSEEEKKQLALVKVENIEFYANNEELRTIVDDTFKEAMKGHMEESKSNKEEKNDKNHRVNTTVKNRDNSHEREI